MTRSRSFGIMFATLAILGGIAGLYLLWNSSRFTRCTASFTLLSIEPIDEYSVTAKYRLSQSGHTTVDVTPGLHQHQNRSRWPSTIVQEEPWTLFPEATGGRPASTPAALKRLSVEIGKEYEFEPGVPLVVYNFTPTTGKPQFRSLALTRNK